MRDIHTLEGAFEAEVRRALTLMVFMDEAGVIEQMSEDLAPDDLRMVIVAVRILLEDA